MNFLNLEGLSSKPHRGFGFLGRNFVFFLVSKTPFSTTFTPKMPYLAEFALENFAPKFRSPDEVSSLFLRDSKSSSDILGGVKERESAQNHLNMIFWRILVVRRFFGQKGDFLGKSSHFYPRIDFLLTLGNFAVPYVKQASSKVYKSIYWSKVWVLDYRLMYL